MNKERIKEVQKELNDAKIEYEKRLLNPWTNLVTKLDLIRIIERCEGYLQAIKEHWGNDELQRMQEDNESKK